MKTTIKQINTIAEKRMRNLLRLGDLIRYYILILLIFCESRFMLPRPILWAKAIYSIFSISTPSILAEAASPATQSVVMICDFFRTASSVGYSLRSVLYHYIIAVNDIKCRFLFEQGIVGNALIKVI